MKWEESFFYFFILDFKYLDHIFKTNLMGVK